MSKISRNNFGDLVFYHGKPKELKRLAQRSKAIVDPFLTDIQGAKVLDLGSHDGRWAYALSAAGAKSVTGIEGRQELVDRFTSLPNSSIKSKINIICGDIFEHLEHLSSNSERFEVVAVFGVFYHIMDHFRLLQLVSQLRPNLIIIDSEFIETENAMIQLVNERTDNVLNSTPQIYKQKKAVIGIPSKRALRFMSEALNYELNWVDKDAVFGGDREGLHDYFRDHRKVRSTCYLTPKAPIN